LLHTELSVQYTVFIHDFIYLLAGISPSLITKLSGAYMNFFWGFVDFNRTDKILVRQEKTPDPIKRWKRIKQTSDYNEYYPLYKPNNEVHQILEWICIFLTQLLHVRNIYKICHVYIPHMKQMCGWNANSIWGCDKLHYLHLRIYLLWCEVYLSSLLSNGVRSFFLSDEDFVGSVKTDRTSNIYSHMHLIIKLSGKDWYLFFRYLKSCIWYCILDA